MCSSDLVGAVHERGAQWQVAAADFNAGGVGGDQREADAERSEERRVGKKCRGRWVRDQWTHSYDVRGA